MFSHETVAILSSVVLVGGLEDDLPLSEATSNSQVSHSQCTRILEECRPCVEQDKVAFSCVRRSRLLVG